MYVDLRKVHAITKKDCYPFPCVDDLLDALGITATYFSTLNMAAGYWQVALAEFTTFAALYEFNVAPFGLVNMPSFFHRLMDTALQDLYLFRAQLTLLCKDE